MTAGTPERWLLVVDRGLEDVALDEARERFPGARPAADARDLPGLVRVELPLPADAADAADAPDGGPAAGLLALRTALHVARLVAETDVASLDDLREAAARIEVPELACAASFRVTAHVPAADARFTRAQAAGAAGAALQRRHGTPVDLEGFAVNVRLDVAGPRLLLSVQANGEPLSRRVRRGRSLRASLKATTAAALVRLAGAHRGAGALVDPLCGAGTIVVEAAGANGALALFASDRDAPTLDVARATFANHSLDVATRVADARQLRAAWDGCFDFVVTNPPYGARLGRRTSLATLYRDLLRSFAEALGEAGRVVLLTPRLRALERALVEAPFEVVDERRVAAGDYRPRIVVLARR